jgi:hypothetical protein
MSRMLVKDPSLRIKASEIDEVLDENFNIENQFKKMEINSQRNENIRYSCDNDFPMIKHPILGIIF